MKITKDTLIGELVAKDYRTASVFKQNEIDFCCNGNRTIEEACLQKNADSSNLLQQLEDVLAVKTSGADYNSWPLDLLADYIEKTHHRYVKNKIQEIMPLLEKIVRVHGASHPELLEIEQLFRSSAEELMAHMEKEERVLFSFIRKMAVADSDSDGISVPFGTVKNPIRMMMHEHENEGSRFSKIAALTHNYTPPSEACSTYRVTLSLLKEFEENLHLHIHLENNILFPKSIKMEGRWTKA